MSTYDEMLAQFRQMIRFHSESCESTATLWANLMWLTGGVIGEYFAFCEGCGTVSTLEDRSDCRCAQAAFHEMLEREIDEMFDSLAADCAGCGRITGSDRAFCGECVPHECF